MTGVPGECAHDLAQLSVDAAGNVACAACGRSWQTRRAWYTESAPVAAFRVFVRSALAALAAQREEIESLRRDVDLLLRDRQGKG